MDEEEASHLLDGKHLEGWNRAVQASTDYLTSRNMSWLSLHEPEHPQHCGWSRLVSENRKSKKYYNLLMSKPPGDQKRNPNEQKWRDAGLPTLNSDSQIFYSAGCFTSTESILQFGQSLGSNKHRHHTSKIMRKKEIVVPPPYAISSMFHIECNLFCFC